MTRKQWKSEHKDDMLRYSREWYRRNSKKVIQHKNRRRKESKEWLRDLKGKLKCEQCGQSHIACLQFHHTNPKEKDMNISQLVHGGWGRERILKEIDKCKVLCANCHLIFHWEE